MLIYWDRCDADPEVMADYIIALLKHDATFSEEEWKDVWFTFPGLSLG